jgi:hypothetical protein
LGERDERIGPLQLRSCPVRRVELGLRELGLEAVDLLGPEAGEQDAGTVQET